MFKFAGKLYEGECGDLMGVSDYLGDEPEK